MAIKIGSNIVYVSRYSYPSVTFSIVFLQFGLGNFGQIAGGIWFLLIWKGLQRVIGRGDFLFWNVVLNHPVYYSEVVGDCLQHLIGGLPFYPEFGRGEGEGVIFGYF